MIEMVNEMRQMRYRDISCQNKGDFMKDLIVRKAEKIDIDTVFELIHSLANYEKRPWDVTGTKEELAFWLFERNIATALIAEVDEETIGYAIYYPVFGSFSAKGKAHLEDMFIYEPYRGQGLGKQFLRQIVTRIFEEGFSGMEWSALDWNKSAIKFYEKAGAEQDSGRVYFDFTEENMTIFAEDH